MSLNVPLLQSSFELVIERSPELTTRFYEILFTRFPQVKPLFGRNSGANQAQMLTSALASVVEHLEDAPWLTQTLGAMGKKHVDYGVTDEMYGFVVESLLLALAEAAGADWSPELEQAWTEALNAVGGLMQAGAKSAAA